MPPVMLYWAHVKTAKNSDQKSGRHRSRDYTTADSLICQSASQLEILLLLDRRKSTKYKRRKVSMCAKTLREGYQEIYQQL